MGKGVRLRTRSALSGSRIFFEVAYRVGLALWDHAAPPPELIEVVEGERKLPPGPALDVGCGTGNNSIYMARHGWTVTGIDFVDGALGRARRKAQAADVVLDLRRGDVTRLEAVGIVGSYDFVIDVGCFHSLTDPQQAPYAAGIGRVSAPGATYLLFSFSARPFGRVGPNGVPRERVQQLFGNDFNLIEARPGNGPAAPYWYTLRRH